MPDVENQPGRSPATNPRNAYARKCILIVDDSNSVRSVVREGLETQVGYVCEEAVNGIDAIEKAKKIQPDLVVLDLAMPRLNGVEVAMVLQRETPKIPVVILTMYAEEFGRSLSSSFGVKAVVNKADGMSTLIDCVQGLLGV
jgi:CheY-like chemotaxis protein